MTTRVALLVGGPENMIPDFMQLENQETKWIGVDRGALRLFEKGLVPRMAVGDFDSISTADLAVLKVSENHFRVPALKISRTNL